MYLLLDPSLDDKLRLNLFNSEKSSGTIKETKAEDFLLTIDSVLEENEFSVSDLKKIGVVLGSGKFTATRISSTIANVFNFVRGIKLVAVSREEVKYGSDNKVIQNLSEIINKFDQAKNHYISAEYSGKPNIN